jgi:hypothetical protein
MPSRKATNGSFYKQQYQYIIYSFIIVLILLLLFLILKKKWNSSFESRHPLVLVKRESFMDINNSTKIPRKIHRTYSDKTKIPEKIFTNMRDFAPGYEIHLYDDEDCKSFLQTHFQPEVVDAFCKLKEGAHKADLFRYCVIYIAGGIYLDIKIELLQDISSLYSDSSPDSSTNPTTIYTVIGNDKIHIFQGVIIAPPGQPIFLKLIDHIVANVDKASRDYHMFVQYFLKLIKEDVSTKTITPGKVTGKGLNYYLYEEIATRDANQCYDGLDRHGYCSYIVDVGNNYDGDDDDINQQKKIFKTRYADYPW